MRFASARAAASPWAQSCGPGVARAWRSSGCSPSPWTHARSWPRFRRSRVSRFPHFRRQAQSPHAERARAIFLIVDQGPAPIAKTTRIYRVPEWPAATVLSTAICFADFRLESIVLRTIVHSVTRGAVRIYKTVFVRFARKERVSDESLSEAIDRANQGLVDANLGGHVIKQRGARKGQGRFGWLQGIDRISNKGPGHFSILLRQKRTREQ